jgi:glycosyltransferase involved in cell wall biosynthesis
MGRMKPTLSVIIPVYNEAKTIREILERVQSTPIEKEILIVDDGSKDGTADVLRQIESGPAPQNGNTWRFFYQEKNQGKGAAIRRAQREATGLITIIQDADLECNPGEYATIIQPILDDRADVVYGTRFHHGARLVSSLVHTLGNRFLTLASNIFTDLDITDMETCYKAFRTDLFQSIRIRSNRFDFEPEITAKLAKKNCRIYEVPISYAARSRAQGKKIGLKDAFQALYTIARYTFIKDI